MYMETVINELQSKYVDIVVHTDGSKLEDTLPQLHHALSDIFDFFLDF